MRDYTVKREIYAGFRVMEYWRFDYTGGRLYDAPLAGDRLLNDRYESIPVVEGADGIIRGYRRRVGAGIAFALRTTAFLGPGNGRISARPD